MQGFRYGWRWTVLILCLTAAGCGSKKSGSTIYPGKITLSPSLNASLTQGRVLNFTAAVQSASGTVLNATVTYSSSDTSILNLAPNGVACAGHWDTAFTTCTPGGTGPVTVTASASPLGATITSAPTYVFVHPPIDSVTVGGILPTGIPVQEPCLSQSQSMTLEAHAFSQGADITTSVGPFTWTANNSAVVAFTPVIDTQYDFATNETTATAVTPGITYIYATADGVTSTSFQQPQYANSRNQTSPALDFFATCPIQNIALEMNSADSGQTSFVVSKSGTSESVVATLLDIMGNTSLPNTDGGVVLSKIPLTWASSQPQVAGLGSSCTQSCPLTLSSPGAASITASCSPPTCNVGFPEIPSSFTTNGQLDQSKIQQCTEFFQALYPQLASCQQVIPVPVYSSPVFVVPPSWNCQSQTPQNCTWITPQAAISGLITGSASSSSVLLSSTGCSQINPATCTTAVYFPSTSSSSVGTETPMPGNPTSFLFDANGDRIYMGSNFGAEIINPSSFGSNNSPFQYIGTTTGNVLATSANGVLAAFSDTSVSPNQVYITNAVPNFTSTALAIPNATAAAFSPDGLKAYILSSGGDSGGDSLYIYSPLQALQGPIALSGPANAVAFSPNGAFAYVAQASTKSGPANLTAFATCNNQIAASLPLPASPIAMKVLPNVHMDGVLLTADCTKPNSCEIPDGVHILVMDSTGFDVITSTISPQPAGTLCPQGLAFVSGDPSGAIQRIELGQTIQPPPAYSNFFTSADASLLYVLTGSSSTIFTYNFVVGSTTGGIELANNATPVSADMTVDTGTIFVAGSDGELHEVSTGTGGADLRQFPFSNLPDYSNPFCTYTPTGSPCTFNFVAVKP
jgi:hypothetical protein